MTKLCIFDLDGTLMNTIPAISHFGNTALKKFGFPEIEPDRYKLLVGNGRDLLIHRMLAETDSDTEENFEKVERHNETDEVFVLLNGSATLIVGEELNRIEMEPHKLYNVPAGVWHHIFTNEDTSVLIVENEDTSDDNSEYLYINEISK